MPGLLQAMTPLFKFGCVQDSPATLDLCFPVDHVPLSAIAHPSQLLHLLPINYVNDAASTGSGLTQSTSMVFSVPGTHILLLPIPQPCLQ